MSEERQYREVSHRQQSRMDQDYSDEEEEECEPRTHPVEGLYSRGEIEKLRNSVMMI